MEIAGQDERIAKLLGDAEGILAQDRERGIVLSTECYRILRQRMRDAEAAAKTGTQLRKFTAATDLDLILGAARRELGTQNCMNGIVAKARRMLDEISECQGMKDGEGRSLVTEEIKREMLWELRDGACKDPRKFSLVSGELNSFVEWLVANKAEDAAGVKLPERLREKYHLQPEKRTFCAR